MAQDVLQLLPHFDCYVIGCHPRNRLVPAAWAKRVLTRGSIGNLPVVVVDSVVAGLWQQRRSRRSMEIWVQAFQPLRTHQYQQLEASVRRVGEIVEAESFFTLGAVDVHPHL